MKPLLVVNFYRWEEIPAVQELYERFTDIFFGISNLKTKFTTHRVDSMEKHDVNWTKRFLSRVFFQEFTHLIKVDPDTKIDELIIPDVDFDVAGDFRHYKHGWLWFGGYHVFTRSAAMKLAMDTKYIGHTATQDGPLTKAVIRNEMIAYNMAEVNCWKKAGDLDTPISHRGSTDIKRLPEGFIKFC